MYRHLILAAGLAVSASHAAADTSVTPYPAIVQGYDTNKNGWADPVYANWIWTTVEEGKPFVTTKVLWGQMQPNMEAGLGRVALAIVPDQDGDGRPDIATSSGKRLDFYDTVPSDSHRYEMAALDPAQTERIAAVRSLDASLDGDKKAEIAVGAADYSPSCAGLAETDAVYATSSVTGGRTWKSTGPRGGGMFGAVLANLSHDYDGDGIDDIATTDVCQTRRTATGVSAGAIYVLSARTGAILKTFRNPTVRPAATAARWWFGSDLVETADVTGDGIPELAVGEPAAPGATVAGGVTLISGSDGSLVCRYAAPKAHGSKFGVDLDGGDFAFGKPYRWVPRSGYRPHDILVGSPGKGMFVLRLDPKTCGTGQTLVKVIPATPKRKLGFAVAVLRPPKTSAGLAGVTLATVSDAWDTPKGLFRYSGLTGAYVGNFGKLF
jgi:hypothetical protein